MFIQGDLQAVFDALYSIGTIDPILQMDWKTIQEKMSREPQKLKVALKKINDCAGDRNQLVETLKSFEPATIHYVAIEVARELADSQEKTILH